MRSRKPPPLSIVTRTTMRSLSTRVPPVTAQRRLGRKDSYGRERRAHHGHKHDRVLDHQARVEFLERVNDRRAGNVPVEKGRSFLLHKLKALKKVFPGG